jgi:hypothetical protein
MFNECDGVVLKKKNSDIPLPPGTRGTVLIVHAAQPPAYEVEFVNDAGEYLGVYTVSDTDLMPRSPNASFIRRR